MPNLGKKQGKKSPKEKPEKAEKAGKAGKAKKPPKAEKSKTSKIKLGKKKNQDVDESDEEVVVGVTSPEDDEGEEVETPKPKEVVEVPPPFTDGIVASCLKDLVVVPRVSGQDVDMLRGFLKYYSITEPFIGAITTKHSFMKKTGGRLL